jgi:cell division protein FtsZ
VDDVLLQAVSGIVDVLTAPGLINLDFADVRAVVQDAGPALIGIGRGSGEQRAVDAARQAISSPLLEASIHGASGILFNVSGPADLRLREVKDAADEIRASADPRANVIFGASLGEVADGEVLITLIATGLDTEGAPHPRPSFARRIRHHVETSEPMAHERPLGPDRPEPALPQALASTAEDSLEVPAFLRKNRSPAGRRRPAEDQALTPRSASHSS